MTSLRRPSLLALLGALLGLALPSAGALAQSYPSKPIKAIVPFAAGSATDQIGRAFAQKMSREPGADDRDRESPGCEWHAGRRCSGQGAR